MTTLKKLALCLLVSVGLSLSGCFDLATTIELESSGAGQVTLAYRLDNRLLDLGVFDGPTDEPAVPISRRDFELALQVNGGARLVSHNIRRGETHTDVSAVVAFDSVADFNLLFGTDPEALVVEADSITLVLAPGIGELEIDEELIASQFADYELRFRISADEFFTAASRGSVVDGGRAAELVLPLSQAVLSTEDVVWRLTL